MLAKPLAVTSASLLYTHFDCAYPFG